MNGAPKCEKAEMYESCFLHKKTKFIGNVHYFWKYSFFLDGSILDNAIVIVVTGFTCLLSNWQILKNARQHGVRF